MEVTGLGKPLRRRFLKKKINGADDIVSLVWRLLPPEDCVVLTLTCMRNFIPVYCPLTCGRLVNLKGKLVMMGEIGKHDRPDIIKGYWHLDS